MTFDIATAATKPAMTATIDPKTKELVIRIAVNETPVPSSTGKTLLVANGNLKSTIMVNGKQVTVGVNAYIKA